MERFRLTEQQMNFFDTFGFVHLPGLMADCIDEITTAFEQVWEERGGGHNGQPHDGESRSCIVPFIDQHERLCALLDDPRIEGSLISLLGDDFNYTGSDGNYYSGDTRWHSDGFGNELRFVKIAFYLDNLTRDTGCLRVIPGSHRRGDGFSELLDEDISTSEERWGLTNAEVPAVALETSPGDVLAFQHNLKHAAFGGGGWRRMFTINCSVRFPEDKIPILRKYNEHMARFWVDRVYGEKMIATATDSRMVHLEQVMANDDHLAALSAKARAEMNEPSRG
jgi:hypothetical protein